MITAILGRVLASRSADALNRGDLATYLGRWADDVTFVCQGTVSVAGTFVGKEAVQQWHQRLLEQFPERKVTIKAVYVRNPLALLSNDFATEWDWSGTNKDGKQSQNSGVTILRMRKGKATYVQQYVFDANAQREDWGE